LRAQKPEIALQVVQMGPQVFKRLPLRPMIRMFFQISKPVVLILPVNVLSRFHETIIGSIPKKRKPLKGQVLPSDTPRGKKRGQRGKKGTF
jgi:hypothetical protein